MSTEPQANFTPRSQQVINQSKKLAIKLNHAEVKPVHFLSCLISNKMSALPSFFSSLKIDHTTCCNAAASVLRKVKVCKDESAYKHIKYSKESKEVLFSSIEVSENLGHPYVGVEHILIAILEQNNKLVQQIFDKLGGECSELHMILHNQLFSESSMHLESHEKEESVAPSLPSTTGGSAVEKYCKNLNTNALHPDYVPLINKDDELNSMCEVLCRKTKNNPMLLGEAGVGKTALAEGLAAKIVQKKCPSILQNKTVFALDLGLLVAGTKYRGQFEERLKKLLSELKLLKNGILFIDEIHTLIGAGGAEGSMDACNLLKPALARGEISCIGATTNEEYKKSIRKDGAINRRFHSIEVKEPTPEETVDILKGLSVFYENFHGVKYSLKTLKLAVDLCDKYINEGHFPDKAIDIIDHAGAKLKMNNFEIPDIISKIEEDLAAKIEDTTLSPNSPAPEDITDLFEEYEKELSNWNHDTSERFINVTEEDIRKVVSEKCKIPIKELTGSMLEELASLRRKLKSQVINQSKGIDAIYNCLKRGFCGLKEENKPVGSFLFLGSTGVGKTHLSKTLAKTFFKKESSFISVDMSEFSEQNSITKMIGSAPGYVGYEEGGTLTEKVRSNPHSVILFDEIEKAHPDVMNILLQILEEGRLTDNTGFETSFQNTIIIATSNIGASAFSGKGNLGFMNQEDSIQSKIKSELEKNFRPELINRFDDIISFNQLRKEDIKKIISLEFRKIKTLLSKKNIKIQFSEAVKDFVLELNLDEKYGARFTSRLIKEHIYNKVADFILKNPETKNINLSCSKNGKSIKLD